MNTVRLVLARLWSRAGLRLVLDTLLVIAVTFALLAMGIGALIDEELIRVRPGSILVLISELLALAVAVVFVVQLVLVTYRPETLDKK